MQCLKTISMQSNVHPPIIPIGTRSGNLHTPRGDVRVRRARSHGGALAAVEEQLRTAKQNLLAKQAALTDVPAAGPT